MYSIIASTKIVGAQDTPNINTIGADLIIIAQAGGGGVGHLPTDNQSNVYAAFGTTSVGGGDQMTLYYKQAPATSATHNFHQNLSYEALFVLAVSGSTTTPADQQNGAGNTAATSQAPGSITPSENDELVVLGVMLGDTASSPSVGGGFTLAQSLNSVSGVSYGGGIAYLIQTTAAAANPTYSWTGTAVVAARIASFKAPSSGSLIKTIKGLAKASVKSVNGLAIASVKTINGLA